MACVSIPRFALRIAAGDRLDAPAALAPLAGQPQILGEVSRLAEEAGVHAGMALGEGFGYCPSLRLIPPDPARESEVWERVLRRLEGIGAAVESERPGEAFFSVDGLIALHGGEVGGVLAAARRALGPRVRIAAAPNRFVSRLAASRGSGPPRGVHADGGEAIVLPATLRGFLAPFPLTALTSGLGSNARAAKLVSDLQRLGFERLGAFSILSREKVADRFGPLGLRALELARGGDTPLRPRVSVEEIGQEIDLPAAVAGLQLARYLELLVDRLLADPRRKERAILALRLFARLAGGGSWSAEQGFGRPTARAGAINLLLAPRLEELPGPAEQLGLRVLAFGPEAVDQLELSLGPAEMRGGEVAAAVREVRAATSPEALLRVIDVNPRSHLPERRYLLAPYPAR